jgi:hypothetical protein
MKEFYVKFEGLTSPQNDEWFQKNWNGLWWAMFSRGYWVLRTGYNLLVMAFAYEGKSRQASEGGTGQTDAQGNWGNHVV